MVYKVTLDKEWELRLNHKALFEIDRELRVTWGEPLFAVLSKPLNSLSMELIVTVLKHSLIGKPSQDAILEMMDADGFNYTELVKSVIEAVTNAFGVEEDTEEKKESQ